MPGCAAFVGVRYRAPSSASFHSYSLYPYPLGTGAFKKIRHTLNPPLYIVTQITQIYIIYYTASSFRYQPSVRTLLKILFPARSSAAAFPPCPSGLQAAFFVSFEHRATYLAVFRSLCPRIPAIRVELNSRTAQRNSNSLCSSFNSKRICDSFSSATSSCMS